MDGAEVPTSTVVELKQLGKLMTLKSNKDGATKATDDTVSISNNNEVKINDKGCSDYLSMIELRDRTIFDLALTPEQAAARRLQLMALEASDMSGLDTQGGEDAGLNNMKEELLKNMTKMLNNLVDGVLNREIIDVHRKYMEAQGLTAPETSSGSPPPQGPPYELLPEEIIEYVGLEDLVSLNETKSFAIDEDADTVELMMKLKCLKDLSMA